MFTPPTSESIAVLPHLKCCGSVTIADVFRYGTHLKGYSRSLNCNICASVFVFVLVFLLGICSCPDIFASVFAAVLIFLLQLYHVRILFQAMRRRVSQKRRCSRGSIRTTRSSCTRRCWPASRSLPRGRVHPPHSSVWNKIQ